MENNEENKIVENTVSSGENTVSTAPVGEITENNVTPNVGSTSEENKIIESAVSGIESDSSISQGQADINNQTVTPEPVIEEKKKSKLPIIIVCVVLVACLGVGAFFFLGNAKPYEAAINSVFKALNNSKFFSDAYKVTANIKMDMKGASTEETKIINDFSFKMETEVDKDMNSYGKYSLMKGNSSILDLVAYFKDNKVYLGADKLTDKILYEDLGSIIDLKDVKYDRSDIDHLLNKLEEALKAAFKDETSNKEDKKITINGKEVTVKNNYYVINSENTRRVITNFVNVFNNEETIKVLAKITNSKAEEIKEELDSVKDLKDSDFANASSIKVCFYTKGLLNELVGFALEVKDTEMVSFVGDGDYSLLKITAGDIGEITAETKDKVTEVKIVSGKQTVLNIKVTEVDDNNATMVINMLDQVTITAEVKYENIKSINTLDTSKAVKSDELTEEDEIKIEENLSKILEEAGLGGLFNSMDESTVIDGSGLNGLIGGNEDSVINTDFNIEAGNTLDGTPDEMGNE